MTDEQFLDRWKVWRQALNGRDDSHSLVQQVETICWDVATFEALMASWRLETAGDGETLNVNLPLFHFVTGNFVKSLCLSLRRLTEAGALIAPEGARRDRSVYSLRSLLADIAKHRHEYTRQRLFMACELEFDDGAIRRRHDEWLYRTLPEGGVTSVPRELNDFPNRATHEQWNRLCRRPGGSRDPVDTLAADHLEALAVEFERMHTAVEYIVNSHFAHAATPESRASVDEKKESISLAELLELVVSAARGVNSLSAVLSWAVFPFLATAQFDKWENWGRGWSATNSELEAAWRDWDRRINRVEPLYPD